MTRIWDWAKSFALAFIVVLILHQFVFFLSTVKGSSMEPTLQNEEWLFINKISYMISKPKLHDIVILESPNNDYSGKSIFLVKRIIAKAGDTIEIRHQTLFVNGKAMTESYTDAPIEDGDYGPLTVPEDQFFVMGDNRHRDESKDSRAFGTVAADEIQGKAQFIIYPFNKWRAF